MSTPAGALGILLVAAVNPTLHSIPDRLGRLRGVPTPRRSDGRPSRNKRCRGGHSRAAGNGARHRSVRILGPLRLHGLAAWRQAGSLCGCVARSTLLQDHRDVSRVS